MFEQYFGKAKELLLPKEECKLFPSIDDREVWDGLHPEQKEYFLEMAESYLDYDWPALTAARYMDCCRNGNRSRYTNMESKRRAALLSLVMAECIENKGRFIDDIIKIFINFAVISNCIDIDRSNMTSRENVMELIYKQFFVNISYSISRIFFAFQHSCN